ncbi:CDP-alcohol phosphatidyltransferase family protein [Novosphingobium piscinae]|uniref:Phosphatidylcholine/phosphatidylserine synthase n=1 Tax=Novosphingobium piscinae TaxID=1507448 RepID=A0A7X1KPE1_9SPHN|nr:phosphatidylcholine/phosphatidylserine synthase [Novosphingobium piscinae]
MSDARERRPRREAVRLPGGLTLRALVPNAITAAALASGLTGIRFAITAASGTPVPTTPGLPLDDWQKAVLAVILAGMLDGVDGRIARLLKAQSRFGAELDSLSDVISFGVAPALILFLWSLQDVPRLGWFAALAFAICMALRLARFNARIDMADEPRKAAGYLTGVPAPVGAGLAFLPLYLWIASGNDLFRRPELVGIWLLLTAFLLISSLPTLSWASMRPRRSVRLELIGLAALVFAALISEPWLTLAGICLVYLLLVPYGWVSYARIRRQRGERG